MLIVDSIENDESKLINRCPATILAVRRTAKVIGRIILLIVSMITIKFISWTGVPIGVKWVIRLEKFMLKLKSKRDVQKVIEIEKEIEMCAVNVKLKGNRAT